MTFLFEYFSWIGKKIGSETPLETSRNRDAEL